MLCPMISILRRKLRWSSSIICTGWFTLVIILYLIWKSLDTELPLDHDYMHIGDAEHNGAKKIITVTGRSYNAKFGHVKVYVCSSNYVSRASGGRIIKNNIFWQQVTDSSDQDEEIGLYLYSTYFDTRVRKSNGADKHCFVRILAMLEQRSINNKYYCQLWFGLNASRPVAVDADLQEIWSSEWDSGDTYSNTARLYKPYLLSCIVPKKYSSLKVTPVFVSVTTKPCYNATNIYEVYGITAPIKKPGNSFAVCVKPLDFDQDLSKNLVQWLEMNFIFGATQIDIYTFRTHPNVRKVLEYYRSSGRNVKVIPMSLPGYQPNFPVERSQFLKRNIWQKRRNELIPYNDCLYRNMYTHDYIIPLDIDEILVPKLHKNWIQLFDFLQESKPEKMKYYASYSVRNAFYLESFSNLTESQTSSPLYFLKHVYRSANYTDMTRSVKSFVQTDKTLTVFNHYALDAVVPGVGLITVLPVELIQMNHYRKTCPVATPQECKNNFLKYKVFDGALLKYKDELERRTNDIVNNLTLN